MLIVLLLKLSMMHLLRMRVSVMRSVRNALNENSKSVLWSQWGKWMLEKPKDEKAKKESSDLVVLCVWGKWMLEKPKDEKAKKESSDLVMLCVCAIQQTKRDADDEVDQQQEHQRLDQEMPDLEKEAQKKRKKHIQQEEECLYEAKLVRM